MKEVMEQAQAAANKAQTAAYVFRAVGLNGHESYWFNLTGRTNSPNDELVAQVVPQQP